MHLPHNMKLQRVHRYCTSYMVRLMKLANGVIFSHCLRKAADCQRNGAEAGLKEEEGYNKQEAKPRL